MFASGLIGAIPRMGKTFLLRLLLLVAGLDPRAEVHAYDFKGTGDLAPLEAVAHRYRAGDDEDDMAYVLADFRALREEMRRRTKVIRSLPRDVCPENKVTPELASKKSLGLHPVVIGADEVQVMFEHPAYGAEFEEICTDLVKRGPALGMFLLLATQRIDAKSIPTPISANAVLRTVRVRYAYVERSTGRSCSARGSRERAAASSASRPRSCPTSKATWRSTSSPNPGRSCSPASWAARSGAATSTGCRAGRTRSRRSACRACTSTTSGTPATSSPPKAGPGCATSWRGWATTPSGPR